jgi:alpha-amylase
MLAQPYGLPSILSAYWFDCPAGNSMGPPSDAAGWTLPVTCAASLETAALGQFVCEHRDPYLRHMVGFRRAAAGTAVTHWWDNGDDAIAFSRGDKGFVAINNEAVAVTATVTTGMAGGTYCDRLTGGKSGGVCAGTAVTVDPSGAVQLNLAARTAIAIDVTTKL